MIKKLASDHLGENVAVVVHGGIFKLLNFYLGHGTKAIPYGEVMVIETDADNLYVSF